MTTCAQCLQALSTMSLTEARPGSAVADHCATCPRCASVIEETSYAERRLSGALAEARSSYTPEDLSYRVLAESERVRRKEVGRWARGLLAAAGCVTFWFFMQNVVVPWTDGANRTFRETVTLKCLTAEQASEIATPYLRSSGSAIYLEKDVHTITIRGRADEFVRAKAEITGVDSRQHCDLNKNGAATSGDRPKKD
jgi:hypothetical protein